MERRVLTVACWTARIMGAAILALIVALVVSLAVTFLAAGIGSIATSANIALLARCRRRDRWLFRLGRREFG